MYLYFIKYLVKICNFRYLMVFLNFLINFVLGQRRPTFRVYFKHKLDNRSKWLKVVNSKDVSVTHCVYFRNKLCLENVKLVNTHTLFSTRFFCKVNSCSTHFPGLWKTYTSGKCLHVYTTGHAVISMCFAWGHTLL